ncbi:hypothetical protein [uncultured Thiohalocapsa sp.]|uniref:hypothetical protein n=1 Tax=uncultured Thiohalocapsa sp. TaxID=768990 RepID=UPI0025CFCF9F|nr:hypothetical protein [uncultured Thiohalocapsa sp.]
MATELLQSLRGQEGMGLLAHGGERRLPVDARIQEQGQDLRPLLHIVAGLKLEPVDGLLGGGSHLVDVTAHQGAEGAQPRSGSGRR